MTSSDPTRDPSEVDNGPESSSTESGFDSAGPKHTDDMEHTDDVEHTGDAPSTDLVPHDDAGEVVDPRDASSTSDGSASGTSTPEKKPDGRPAVNRQTRIGAAWVAVAVGVIVLVLLLIFILQNLSSVTVKYFGAHGTMPLGVLLLFAAAGGALLVIVLGVARMLQMRLLARRDRKSIR